MNKTTLNQCQIANLAVTFSNGEKPLPHSFSLSSVEISKPVSFDRKGKLSNLTLLVMYTSTIDDQSASTKRRKSQPFKNNPPNVKHIASTPVIYPRSIQETTYLKESGRLSSDPGMKSLTRSRVRLIGSLRETNRVINTVRPPPPSQTPSSSCGQLELVVVNCFSRHDIKKYTLNYGLLSERENALKNYIYVSISEKYQK